MKKIILGLVIIVTLIGCGEPPKPTMNDTDFNKVLEYSTEYLINNNTEGFALTEDQEKKISNRIQVLKEEKQERDARMKEIARQRKLELEKQKKLKGDWKQGTFVDEFGDATDEKYFWLEISNSSFSNSATRNKTLDGKMIISKNHLRFDNYEYGRNRGGNTTRFIGGGTAHFKNSQGKTLKVPINDGLTVFTSKYKNDYTKVINFMKSSKGDVRVILIDRYPNTTHSFSINANGFTYNYKEMRK